MICLAILSNIMGMEYRMNNADYAYYWAEHITSNQTRRKETEEKNRNDQIPTTTKEKKTKEKPDSQRKDKTETSPTRDRIQAGKNTVTPHKLFAFTTAGSRPTRHPGQTAQHRLVCLQSPVHPRRLEPERMRPPNDNVHLHLGRAC